MKKRFLLLLFILSSCGIFYSQNILWEKSYGGDKVEYLFDAIPTKDYGFLLAESSLSSAKGDVVQKNQGNYNLGLFFIFIKKQPLNHF